MNTFFIGQVLFSVFKHVKKWMYNIQKNNTWDNAYQFVFHRWARNTPIHLTIFNNACISQCLHWEFILEQQKAISYHIHMQWMTSLLPSCFSQFTQHISTTPLITFLTNSRKVGSQFMHYHCSTPLWKMKPSKICYMKSTTGQQFTAGISSRSQHGA